jgi:DNA invertase Pin-like site-specific DNA recombinase
VTLEGPAGWREPSPILLLFAEETSIDAMLKHDIMMMRVINGRYRLIDFAREQGYSVPDDWVIEDEGFSGASLLRPGLERLRDLAAEGHIQAVLIHSPDRLSRKYAYQVLLTEELPVTEPRRSF